MARIVAGNGNAGTVYIGPSNVTSSVWSSRLSPDQPADITIDSLQAIYVYGTSGDTVNYTYFTGVL